MKNIILVLLSTLALTACKNNDADESSEVDTNTTTTEVASLTTKPQFKVKSIRDNESDQLELNFSKSVNIELEVFDKENNSIYQYTSTDPMSEYSINMGSEYNASLLDYGTYHYILTLTRDGNSRTLNGEFTKGVRLIHQFDNKVSDLLVSGDQLYVATGDYMHPVEVNKIDTSNDQVSSLTLDNTQLPKPIYAMKIQDDTLYLGGQKNQWLGGNLLVSYSLRDQNLTVLDADLKCITSMNTECSAVFSLQPYGEDLYIGTSNGLYVKNNKEYSKVIDTGLDSESDIKTQFEDQQGRLWIGSMFKGGIAMKDNGRWQTFTEQNSALPAGGIMDFSQTPSGEILIADNINGLIQFNPDKDNWNHYTPANSEVFDHYLISVAYRDGVLIGSHDYGIAKSKDLSKWQVSNNTNSAISTIDTDACELEPSSKACKKVIVVERMVTDSNGRVFAAIGKSVYELY